MRRSAKASALPILAVLAALLAPAASAQVGADLNVSPKRLVFEGANRSATAYLFNRGSAPAVYTVEMADRFMGEDGQILAVADARTEQQQAIAGKVHSAKPFITLTPRRVTLQPGQSQTVRLRVLRPADLAPGEYRTHLTFTALPAEDLGLTAAQAAAPVEEGQVGTRVVGLFSLSIPLIVREGPVEARAAIEKVVYNVRNSADADGKPSQAGVVSLDLVRLGAGSIYGDVEVRTRGGKAQVVGMVRGFAVYPEVDRRPIEIVLNRLLEPGEQLDVSFKSDDITPGKVLATASLAR